MIMYEHEDSDGKLVEILSELERKHNIPRDFLIEIIKIEEQHLFQLKRRNVISKLEKMISDFISEEES